MADDQFVAVCTGSSVVHGPFHTFMEADDCARMHRNCVNGEASFASIIPREPFDRRNGITDRRDEGSQVFLGYDFDRRMSGNDYDRRVS